MPDPSFLPPLPPKWTDTEARKVIAGYLSNDTDCDDTDCAASGISMALAAAGYVIWPASALAALEAERAALAEALDAATHEFAAGAWVDGVPIAYCGVQSPAGPICGAAASDPVHRRSAQIRAEHGLGAV
jgi:hypothetical protein